MGLADLSPWTPGVPQGAVCERLTGVQGSPELLCRHTPKIARPVGGMKLKGISEQVVEPVLSVWLLASSQLSCKPDLSASAAVVLL